LNACPSVQGFGAVRTFVHSVFLSRQADLTTLLKFANPKATLTHTLSKYAGQGLEAPVTRLVAETGRLSISPIFVSGVYSGARKLGEGFGSSLKMSEFRANEDALRRIYLSPSARPLLAPEDADSTHGQGAGELPTDTLVYPGRRLARTRALPDDETLYQSAGKSGVVAGSR
jgi:large subunit ribosomal protein L44